jgi:NAD-dependent deacetylase
MRCRKFYGPEFIKKSLGIPTCDDCGGLIKPDVVLYEEGLDNDVISGAVRAIAKADCLIIGGTSLVVYPAAGLIDYFKGDKLVLVNKSATTRDTMADLVIREPIGEVFSQIHV